MTDPKKVLQVIVTDKALYSPDRGSEMEMPLHATTGSAAIDLKATQDIVLGPGEQFLMDTGLRIYIGDPEWAGMLLPRSGLGVKGLVLGNGTGLIDSDYQGPLKACLLNRLPQPPLGSPGGLEASQITIKRGDRIAQYVLVRVNQMVLKQVTEFQETGRGTGGFGSTGAA